VELTGEERAMLAGAQGEAVRRALDYQMEVGRFFGAERFVPITNAHMMGDIEVLGDAGLAFLCEVQGLGRGRACRRRPTRDAWTSPGPTGSARTRASAPRSAR